MDVYLEVGTKRTFAGAIDWPGWCRAGRDESSALDALAGSGPRYGRVLRGTRLGFRAPDDSNELTIVERLRGDATTDFGAPGATRKADAAPMSEEDVSRSAIVLRAMWRAFDRAVDSAGGRELKKGPRGGGRSLNAIVQHLLESEVGYLGALGWKAEGHRDDPAQVRRAVLAGLEAGARGKIPRRGPRGGKRWAPRYFVRRTAWHALDHAWEIEDRLD